MIVFVSGFQRCGSSLAMQMLAAGGMRVIHDPHDGYPAYESSLNLTGEPLDAYDGCAMKWLEPMHAMPPPVPFDARTIWMTRDHVQQARSAVKFMRLNMGMKVQDTAIRRFRRSYGRDEERSIALWERRGPVLLWSFEAVLSGPLQSAAAFAEFIGRPLNLSAMIRQVRVRDAACFPDLLEDELVAAGRLAV